MLHRERVAYLKIVRDHCGVQNYLSQSGIK